MRCVVLGLLLLATSALGDVHLSSRRHVVVKQKQVPAKNPAVPKAVKPAVPPPPAKVEAPLVNAAAKKTSLRAPAPAPGPAPITQEDIISKMKEKMAEKVGHYDADYVLDRPTTVPPGHDGQLAPGPKTNLVPNQKPAEPAEGPAGAPGAAPAPAPAPVPDTGMTEAALNPLVKHNDNETMTDDWGQEYGPKGPRGLHGPYQPMGGHSSASRNGLGAFFAASLVAALLSCRL